MKTLNSLVLCLVLAACASSGTKVQESDAAQFQKGATTIPDVEKALGKPQVNTLNADGTRSIAYVYSHAQAKAASFIPIVGLFAGGAKGDINMVKFDFDTAGKMTNYSVSASNTDMTMGGSSGQPPPQPK